MSHFLYSLVSGHLICFHVLPFNTAINVGVQILQDTNFSVCRGVCVNVCVCVYIHTYTKVGLLDHMVFPFTILQAASILLSIVTAPIYTPTNDVQGFPFTHILSICLVFVWF